MDIILVSGHMCEWRCCWWIYVERHWSQNVDFVSTKCLHENSLQHRFSGMFPFNALVGYLFCLSQRCSIILSMLYLISVFKEHIIPGYCYWILLHEVMGFVRNETDTKTHETCVDDYPLLIWIRNIRTGFANIFHGFYLPILHPCRTVGCNYSSMP